MKETIPEISKELNEKILDKDSLFILENRKEISEYLKINIQKKLDSKNEIFNSGRSLGDKIEMYSREYWIKYIKYKLNKTLTMKDVSPENTTGKDVPDLIYNNVLIDTKSSLDKGNSPKNMISAWVLLENLDKEIIYIFSKYKIENDKTIITKIDINHWRELNYDNNKELTFTGSLGRVQIQFKKSPEKYEIQKIEKLKNIILKKVYEAYERKEKKIKKDKEKIKKLMELKKPITIIKNIKNEKLKKLLILKRLHNKWYNKNEIITTFGKNTPIDIINNYIDEILNKKDTTLKKYDNFGNEINYNLIINTDF